MPEPSNTFASRFEQAVHAVDAGDLSALAALLDADASLACQRLTEPAPWLRRQVGDALDGFFARPYLLWFVAEDPVRHGRLPANIAEVARSILETARRHGAKSLQEQLDHALRLVSWSWIARECGVQLALIDVLVDAGAALAGNPENALVNGNRAAAEHLLARGAPLSLASAACLGRWDGIERLGQAASPEEKQFALVLAALNGEAEGARRLLARGADPNRPSESLYSHGTPLHHAVCSGRLGAVQALVEAGASLQTRDGAHGGTPLGWAEYYLEAKESPARGTEYPAIVEYLRDTMGATT